MAVKNPYNSIGKRLQPAAKGSAKGMQRQAVEDMDIMMQNADDYKPNSPGLKRFLKKRLQKKRKPVRILKA